MTRLLLSAALLACLPGISQAEFPGLCAPGSAPKRACGLTPGACLIPKQLCPKTCAPLWNVRAGGLSCLMKKSPCPLKKLCPLKSPCPLKQRVCGSVKQCLPGHGRPGCLTRVRDGICRLVPRPVKSVCRAVCRPSRSICGKDPCCDIDRVVIHVEPCCQPSRCQQCVVPQSCGPAEFCSPTSCGHRPPVRGAISTSDRVMFIPGPAAASRDPLDERLRRLEAEVANLAIQVQRQNEQIGLR